MIDKVKNHIQKNKNYYIVGGVVISVVSVGAAGYILGVKNSGDIIDLGKDNVLTNVAIKPREFNNTVVQMIERSTASKPVHLVGTNLYFNSIREAARETGHQVAMISKCVNGHIADVKGDVFELIEVID